MDGRSTRAGGVRVIGETSSGSKDGQGAADNDKPYTFGRRPTSKNTFPFSNAQYARLLALRGRLEFDYSDRHAL
jgi:hypothetical protein